MLPALKEQGNKLKEQLEKERQECREIEMNIESMNIEVQEPPAIGSAKIICSHCHHRGHRNQISKPCQLKKCCEYTFCGMKDKHPEYFARLNSLKHDLRKKRKDIQELESQTKAMEDFSSNNEYHFIKNLTPRLFAVDPSYKTNKAKLMRDVRLLRSALDGKIPPAQTNDPEQLKILLAKCRKSVQEFPDAPNFFEGETSAEGECSLKNSPGKTNFTKHEVKVAAVCDEKASHCFPRGGSKDISDSSSSSDSDDYRRKKRKRKNIKKAKKRRRHRSSKTRSSSDSGEDPRSFGSGSNFCQQTNTLYYPRYQIPFDGSATANARNFAFMHGTHFQNAQPFRSNFTNMYYLPISVPVPVHIPNVRGLLEGETAVADHTMPVAQGFSSPQNKKKQDQNEWSNLNTLVNIASATFSNAEPPERSPQSNN